MGRQQFYRGGLPEYLDANGDLAPPWERFPNYERHTIGWRMGRGEDWLSYWYAFLDTLAPAYEVRLAYLQRHPPAPMNWADHVYTVLQPSVSVKDDDGEADRLAELLRNGLIASDIAYTTWLRQQQGIRWPWEYAETPETASRYWTREFWFWSRQVAELRGSADWTIPAVPESWVACKGPLETGLVRGLDSRLGLLTLAQMLAAGPVLPPWELGLGTDTFADSFEMSIGYADAFRLWGMCAFDDREQMRQLLDFAAGVPHDWRRWVEEHFHLD